MILDTLRRIVQEVSTATNLDETLAIVVRQVKTFMAVDVCSVYLTDTADGRYVLMATDGLNPSSVGKVRLGRNEGLVGLVGKRQEPVNLKKASAHPNFRYFPETEEERYHSFLGVPLIHFRHMLGILVVQQRDERLFEKDETAFLITIAAQLAGAINTAATNGAISSLLSGKTPSSGFIQGIPGAPGYAIGTVVLPSPFANLASVPDRITEDSASEEAAFTAAVVAVQEELRAAGQRMAKALPSDVRSLFDVYALFLDDDWLFADTIKRIRAGNWAPGAWRDTITEHAQVFEQMEDPYLHTRAEDIRAIGRRILMRLQAGARVPPRYPERCILIGEEVSVARIADVPVEQLAGIVSLRSSALSHTAILARALGIPAVMGLGELPVGRLEGATLVVDGYQGRVILQPSQSVLEEFHQLVQQEEVLSAELQEISELPATTLDGVHLPLYVNTGLLSDIPPSLAGGAEGVGLYRTEFPFMVRDAFPEENEQYLIYREVLESFAPKPVTMRTLDIGGDKALPYFTINEDNPFLGWRGIRVTLDHPEIFRSQLRALLRANAGLNNLRLLFPMISRVEEIEESLTLLDTVYDELLEEGSDIVKPPVGVMIEVPSAIYLADALARRVDFLSIGTNDLAQYLLAVDRNNTRVANLYDCLHPAVINAVREIVDKAHHSGKPATLCGEMAADPAAILLLLGMGIDGLSMNASSLLRVKSVIRNFDRAQASELLLQALMLESETAIRGMLNKALEQAGLDKLVRIRKHSSPNDDF